MTVHDDLVALCRTLGDPNRDLAVLGEGNASARLDDGTVLVTTSGSQLATVTAERLVAVDRAAAIALATAPADAPPLGPEDLAAIAVARPDGTRPVPSIETVLHALLVERTGAAFVGHTHPTAVLGLATSDRLEEAFAAPIFPDEVVVCGPRYLVVPYASPGRDLAAALDAGLTDHHAAHGAWPRAIVLANHGLLALGESAAEVVAVTTMTEKSARIRRAALAVGRLVALPEAEVRSLAGRADEVGRRRLLVDGDA